MCYASLSCFASLFVVQDNTPIPLTLPQQTEFPLIKKESDRPVMVQQEQGRRKWEVVAGETSSSLGSKVQVRFTSA